MYSKRFGDQYFDFSSTVSISLFFKLKWPNIPETLFTDCKLLKTNLSLSSQGLEIQIQYINESSVHAISLCLSPSLLSL